MASPIFHRDKIEKGTTPVWQDKPLFRCRGGFILFDNKKNQNRAFLRAH